MTISFLQQRYTQLSIFKSFMLILKGLCHRAFHHHLHTGLRGPRSSESHEHRTIRHPHERLLRFRVSVYLVVMLFKTITTRPFLHCRCYTTYTSFISVSIWRFHRHLEHSFNRRRRFPMQTSTTVGNNDSTMFQYGKLTHKLYIYSIDANFVSAHFGSSIA
jgi:hypothetical protein